MKTHIQSNHCKTITITDYIRNLGNVGGHATEGLTETGPQDNVDSFLKSFLSDISFEKVALGLEMSAYLLKRFFNDTEGTNATNRYCYSVDKIPLEGFEIIESKKL